MLAWMAFAYLVIYATLKVIGVLHSPVQVDLAAIASVAYFVGKYAQRIDFCIREVDAVKQKVSDVESKLNHHDNRFVHIEAKFASL